ncbi:class I SAM-dependent methyltransferase [Paucibacter sp. AS339]|uniref:class I SAM-dependent methyltransferase n=1 Tax=Paucibacter hankyongi TaxID=3133434 RepID=UPI0030B2409A
MDQSDPCLSTAQAFGSVAQRYTDKYFELSDYQPQLDRFIDGLKPEQIEVLDLACGPGNVSAYLLLQRPGLRIHGLDLAPEMIEIARNKVPGAVFEVGDCRELIGLGRCFDAAVFSFGLSYLSDEDAERCLRALHSQLRPEGLLYLSSITGDPAQSGSTEVNGHQLHTHYRSAEDILALISNAGFHLQFSAIVPSPANASVLTQDLVLIAKR